MRPLSLTLLLAVLLSWPADAAATTMMDETRWEVLGFGPKGHVLCRKERSDGAYGCDSTWLAVFDRTGKRVISIPVYRVGGAGEGEEQGVTGDGQVGDEEGCAKIKPISKSAGKREAAKLEQRFGPFKPGEVLRRPRGKGREQGTSLTGKDLRVVLEVKGKLPELPDEMEAAAGKRAHIKVQLTATRGSETRVLWEASRTLSPGRSRQSEHVPQWWLPELTGGQLGADGTLALVVDGKPRVFSLGKQ